MCRVVCFGAWLALILIACPPSAHAQVSSSSNEAPSTTESATPTGTVSGRVVGPDGNALPGAAVRVDGTTVTTRTDVSGEFRLGAVPAGSRRLVVSYLGLEDHSVVVEVPAAAVLRSEPIRLEQPLYGETVTVRAEPLLEGQAKALNRQRTAINIQNIVAADQIGRFPDPNAAEATQRLPGITLQRDQGEGRYVVVRGTEARLNSMLINGERIPSPEGDVRQVALDVIPADLLEAIELSKALTPDMDGDAIGGAVNLVTRRAPAERRAAATLGAGYNDLVDDGSVNAGASYGERFADGAVGVLLSASTMETDRGSDNFEVEYDDSALAELELRDYVITRERDGFTADLDGRISESSEILFHGIWNEFGDQEFRRARVSKIEDGELERELKDRFEVQQIRAASLDGNHLIGGKTAIDWKLSWAYAEEEEQDRLDSLFLQEDVEFFVQDGDPDNLRADPLNEDAEAFELDEIVNEDNATSEEDVVGQVNVTVPFYRDAELSGLFKLGGKLRSKDKQRDNEIFEVDADDLSLVEILGGFDAGTFFDGRYRIGRFQDPARIRDFATGFERERDVEEDLADYDVAEDTAAVYGLTELQLGADLSLLAGVRWESTDAEYEAFEIVFDDEGDVASVAPVVGSNDTSELLPSAHLRWAFDERSNLRVALSRSLARPNFEDLAPFELVLEEDLEIERGNPELELTTAWNLDVMVERYFSTVGVVSAGVFYKSLEDSIFLFRSDETRGGEEFDVIQPRNGDDAEILGVELVYQNKLRSLDGWLAGLGVYFNYTWTDSEATFFEERPDTRFPGQAEHVGNFALSYERGGFSGRLSLNYHGEYLSEVGEEAAEDLFVDEHFQVDFSASQQLTENLRLFVELINLNDEPFRVYEGSPDRPIQEEIYSWWGTIGLQWDL